MIFKKKDIEKYLSVFDWEFRELFFESSKSFRFWMLNGTFKTPTFSTLKWFSVLSRIDKEEYFKSYTWFEDIENKIELFSRDFNLKNIQKSGINLNWEEELILEENINFWEEIISIPKIITKAFDKYIKNKKYITSSEVSIIFSKKNFIVANSLWNFSKDNLFYNTVFVKLIWEKDWNTEEVFEKITWIDILSKIWQKELFELLEKSVNILENQLSWESSPDWEMEVIIWNEAGWTIIHEAVWHWLEADLQNSSVYKDQIWEKVASELVTIVDNPTLANHRWFYEVDHEWFKAKNTVLIENGVLKSYLHNYKTSQKFWVESTWHARRETYKHKTLVRMWNTFMLPGTSKKEDLIKKVKSWLYVSRMWWWQVNTITWDFVFKVQNGFLIENWKLTKKVKWAMLIWNGPKMLKEVYGVCDDLEFFDWWTCWKGQSMPVSDATPTVLTKLKVSWL